MAISDQLQAAIESDLEDAYNEGFAAALDLIRQYRTPLVSSDEDVDDGYDQSYLDGLDDAIATLENAQ